MNERVRLPASFRDPSGFLFEHDNLLYRQINSPYAPHYEEFMDSGLYQALLNDGLIIAHTDVTSNWDLPEDAFMIIQPEPIHFISYPFEWSFSQLKDAALTTLSIQKKAMEFGMTLKDSSAYNVQFHEGRPLLIDTLSFEHLVEGTPWIGYRQFCQHFLAPLALMAIRDIRLGALLQTYIDGIPLDLASSLLPFRTRLNFSLLSHIHLHAAAEKRYAGKSVNKETGTMGTYGLAGIIENLERTVKKLEWEPQETAWGKYYSTHDYAEEAFEHKKQLVGQYFSETQATSVWDLGANTGIFSRIASEGGVPTISFDMDPAAVEVNYLHSREQSDTHLLPLLIDLTNPTPGLGWANKERTSLLNRGKPDAVFALALIHHLAISNNVPLEDLAEFFSKLGHWLIVEFVPKEDPQVQKLLTNREDIFDGYSSDQFEKTFGQYFNIARKETILNSSRTVYLMEKHKAQTKKTDLQD